MVEHEVIGLNQPTAASPSWQGRIVALVQSNAFSNFIIGVILVAGIMVGLETYEGFVQQHKAIFSVIDRIILFIFVVEVILKILAEGARPWRYFLNPWNLFDFTIVAVSVLPFDVRYVAVLRLARVLRVFRLVTSLPKLQIIVGALLRSIPSMAYVSVLLGLLFYIYAVLAVFNFGHNDPVHFGNLQTAMISLFQAVTMDGWSELMYINILGCDLFGYDSFMDRCTNPHASPIGAPIFFISFIVTGSMIILNFFIGVVLSAMDEVSEEARVTEKLQRKHGTTDEQFHEELFQITQRLQAVQEEVHLIATGLKKRTELRAPVDRP